MISPCKCDGSPGSLASSHRPITAGDLSRMNPGSPLPQLPMTLQMDRGTDEGTFEKTGTADMYCSLIDMLGEGSLTCFSL